MPTLCAHIPTKTLTGPILPELKLPQQLASQNQRDINMRIIRAAGSFAESAKVRLTFQRTSLAASAARGNVCELYSKVHACQLIRQDGGMESA